MLLLVKDNLNAKKSLAAKELFGLFEIECPLHRSLKFTKGTIYAPYLNNASDDKIVTELATQSVVSVYKYTRFVDDKQTPNGVIL